MSTGTTQARSQRLPKGGESDRQAERGTGGAIEGQGSGENTLCAQGGKGYPVCREWSSEMRIRDKTGKNVQNRGYPQNRPEKPVSRY